MHYMHRIGMHNIAHTTEFTVKYIVQHNIHLFVQNAYSKGMYKSHKNIQIKFNQQICQPPTEYSTREH